VGDEIWKRMLRKGPEMSCGGSPLILVIHVNSYRNALGPDLFVRVLSGL
jgi:hypothetical protein